MRHTAVTRREKSAGCSRPQGVLGNSRTQTSVCVQGPVEEPESNRSACGVLSPFFQAFGVEPRDGLDPFLPRECQQ
jgi:hypothetical protein